MNWQLLYLPLFHFLVRYRRTALGPLWLVIAPSLFIALVGFLYAEIGNVAPAVFIPHLTVGLISWTLIQGFITASTTVFQRNRTNILQGSLTLQQIVLIDVTTTFLTFLHQVIIVIVVFVAFGVQATLYSLISLVGLALLVLNGIWVTQAIGVIGARYRDLSEIVTALLRIAFLATPIIWYPGADARSIIMNTYMGANPFFHYIELVRAPLMGNPIAPLSWLVVITITGVGFVFAQVLMSRFARFVPLWV